jgi:hypothetical protein
MAQPPILREGGEFVSQSFSQFRQVWVLSLGDFRSTDQKVFRACPISAADYVIPNKREIRVMEYAMLEQTRLLVVIVALTVLSGLADSQGFLHAARIWRDGQLVRAELAKSAAGFGAGIVMYWLAIRFLQRFGVMSAETQTILWFGITIAAVAIFGGTSLRWASIDRSVAVLVLAGIGWLLVRTG